MKIVIFSSRYGFEVSERIAVKRWFESQLKITFTNLFYCLITLPSSLGLMSLFFAEISPFKNSCPIVAHTKVTRVPLLSGHFCVCDIISD